MTEVDSTEMLVSLGTTRERKERKERMDATLRFILENMETWRQQHPNRWVAVYGAQLIAVEDTWDRLVQRVADGGFDMKRVQTEFLTEKRQLLIV